MCESTTYSAHAVYAVSLNANLTLQLVVPKPDNTRLKLVSLGMRLGMLGAASH